MNLATPHLEKLRAAIENEKLPRADVPRLRQAIARYEKWVAAMKEIEGSPQEMATRLINLCDSYKRHFDLETIFDSKEDFLYRQRGS